jgi:DNA invertase Pin-like site-specific DNA recombinase
VPVMDLYIRVSQLGEREEEDAVEIYEAQSLAWFASNGIELGEKAIETDVSGSTAVGDRDLEALLQRAESGESEGIVTPYIDRFGRDQIEGSLALRRISEAGAKLIAFKDGFDSTSPGSKLVFQFRMAVAEDYLDRVKENFKGATERAIANGVWMPPRVPFGYRKDENRRLVIVEEEAEVVRELFRRKSAGTNAMHLRDWLNGEHGDLVRNFKNRTKRNEKKRRHRETISRSGVNWMTQNRAYVGEMRVPGKKKGQPRVVKNACPPILTEAEWEAGQVKHEYFARTGQAQEAKLNGLVYCGNCGFRCKVGASGKPGEKTSNYQCWNPDCPKKPSIQAKKLETFADDTLIYAATHGDPYLAALIEGDTRYQDALAEVESAKQAMDEFAVNVEIQKALGVEGFAAGIKVRKEAIVAARRQLSEVAKSKSTELLVGTPPDTVEGVEAKLTEARLKSRIRRVEIWPAGRSAGWEDASARVKVYWHGAEEPAKNPPPVRPLPKPGEVIEVPERPWPVAA